MPKQKPSLIAFNAGELDKPTLARIDLENYLRGAEIMENIIPLVQGGMEKAPGTLHLQSTVNNDDGMLYPFIFSETEAFGLEFTPNRLRFATRDGLVVISGAPATLGAWGDISGALPTGGGVPPSGGTGGYDPNNPNFDFDFDFGGIGAA